MPPPPACSAFSARFSSAAKLVRRAAAASSSAGSGVVAGEDTLGRRLLSLVYPKRSAVVTLRQWTEEGKPIQKYGLNRIVRELRKQKRFKHALEICEWMRIQNDFKLLPGDYAVHLDLVAKVRGLASAEKFFEDLPVRMKGQQSTHTALLHAFVQNKMSEKAESLMEKMSSDGLLRCSLPFNHMLSLYISEGQLDKVPKVIQDLKKHVDPCVFTYNLWLRACALKCDVCGAEQVLSELKRRKIDADWVTYSTLATIYIASNHPKAKPALMEMEKRVSVKERGGYSSLITLYASLKDVSNVHRIWSKMKSSFRKMSDMEYKCVLRSLTKLGCIHDAEAIYREWESVSGTRDARVPNILLAYYTGLGMMDRAESFHEGTLQNGFKPCYSTWEILAMGYLKTQKMDRVLECLKNGISSLDGGEGWEPDREIVIAVFHQFEQLGEFEGAERFLVMLRDAGYLTVEIYNLLLRTYAKAGRMPLIIAERMKTDDVQPDEEAHRLIKLTSRFPVGSHSTLMS